MTHDGQGPLRVRTQRPTMIGHMGPWLSYIFSLRISQFVLPHMRVHFPLTLPCMQAFPDIKIGLCPALVSGDAMSDTHVTYHS